MATKECIISDGLISDGLQKIKLDVQTKETPCILVLGMAGSGKSTFVQVCIFIYPHHSQL